jgi:hypothetical protein
MGHLIKNEAGMINHADSGQGSYFAMISGPITKVGNQVESQGI